MSKAANLVYHNNLNVQVEKQSISSDHKPYLESTFPYNLLGLNFSHSLEVEIYQELVLSTSKRFFLLMLVT